MAAPVVVAAPAVAPVVAPAVAPVVTTPALPAPAQKSKDAALGNAAAVIVKAATDVRITVDGHAISRTGGEETFTSPELEPGYTYTYTFKAEAVREGKTVSASKRVRVRAGQTARADFTSLAVAADGLARDVAHITVKLPADARLFVDNVACPLKSSVRSFDTPELEAGRTYYYTLKAEIVRDGRAVSDSQQVVVEAGRDVTVEFKDLAVQAARR